MDMFVQVRMSIRVCECACVFFTRTRCAPFLHVSRLPPVLLSLFVAQHDTLGDATLDVEELQHALVTLGLPSSKDHVTKLFEQMDLDQDEKVTFDEFLVFVRGREEDLYKIYDQIGIDADKGGFLTQASVADALLQGDIAPDAHAAELMAGELMSRIGTRSDLRTGPPSSSSFKSKPSKPSKPRHYDFKDFCTLLLLTPDIDIRVLFDYWSKSSHIDIGEDYTVPDDAPAYVEEKSRLNNFVSGAIAGCVSRTFTAPLDRLKTIMQAGKGDRSIRGMLEYMYREGGVTGFWRGNGINCLKIGPESAIKFMLYAEFKNQITAFTGGSPSSPTLPEKFVAGAGAGFVAQLVVYPLEIIKTRLALSTTGEFRGVRDVVRGLVTDSKWGMFGVYRGITPSLLGIVPYAGIDLMIYNSLKEQWMAKNRDKNNRPDVVTLLSFGAFSSTCGQVVAFPLQVVRTKLQADKYIPPAYNGMVDCFAKTLKEEGFKGLYRGLGPNFLKTIPAISISYAVYETFATRFQGTL